MLTVFQTLDPIILGAVKGYKISFKLAPKQNCLPDQPKMKSEETLLIQEEIESMLKKGAVHEVPHIKGNLSAIRSLFPKNRGETGQ